MSQRHTAINENLWQPLTGEPETEDRVFARLACSRSPVPGRIF